MRAVRTARALDAVVADARGRRGRGGGGGGERYGRSEAPMDFHILGPLEVSDGGRAVALGGVKQRSLLAILLQHQNAMSPLSTCWRSCGATRRRPARTRASTSTSRACARSWGRTG